MYLFAMDSGLLDAISHGGTATVVVLIVLVFLKHIRDNNIRQEKTMKAFKDEIRDISDNFQEQVSIIIAKNTEIATSSVQAHVKVEFALGNLERRVDGLVVEVGTLKGAIHGSHQ